MATNPFCKDIKSVDFNNESHLCRILEQDKHTRIEGLCSEAVFMEDIIEGNFSSVASDFWYTRVEKKYHVYKVITDPSVPLNDLDYQILDGFDSSIKHQRDLKTSSVSIVYFDESSKTFRKFIHIYGNRYSNIYGLGSDMSPVCNAESAEQSQRDPVRLKKACDFLKQRGLLKDAAIKRLFANCWLQDKGVWDIDAFTKTAGGKVVAFEVKQKFPIDHKSYGVNKGQADMLSYLIKNGIRVMHIILRKPVDDKEIHGVDLLTEPKYVERTQWEYARFRPEMLSDALSDAPPPTSISGKSHMAYYRIGVKHFKILKKFRVATGDVRNKLLREIE